MILHPVTHGLLPTAAPPWGNLKKSPSVTREGEEAAGSDDIEGYGTSWALA